MIGRILLLSALCLLAQPAVAQTRAVRPPANLKEATVQGWLKANVQADGFVFALIDDEGAYYLQPAVNQPPAASPRRLWVRFERFAVDADGERSRRTLAEFDCAEQRSRILATDTYGALNLDTPLKSENLDLDDEVPWIYARPDTVGENLLLHACALEDPRFSKPAAEGAP